MRCDGEGSYPAQLLLVKDTASNKGRGETMSGNGINISIATKIIRKLHAWSDPHLPPISLVHATT